jgi:hypothetical protein
LRGEPPHDVDIAARRERHQQLHRPLRPGLRESGCRRCDEYDSE